MTRNESDEKAAINAITQGLLSSSLLASLMDVLAKGEQDQITLAEFYRRWSATHDSKTFTPVNAGALLAYLYLGILFTKENWFELIPDADLTNWDITPVKMHIPLEPSPKLPYFVRRLRNSLGHGNPAIHVPPGITSQDFASRTTITFSDRDPRKPADTFEVELPLGQALNIARALHDVVLKDAAKRFGQTPAE